MIRILLVELRRFTWRRSFRAFGLLALAGILLSAVIVFFTADRGADQARAVQVTSQDVIRDCVRSMEGAELPPGYDTAEQFCREGILPLEQSDPRFRLDSLTDVFEGLSVPLIILGLAFGASFIGAEWHSGTMTTLLTWESRRMRVMAGKVLAVAFAVVLSAIAVQAILGLVLWPVAALRGTTEGTTWDWFFETASVAARGGLISALAAALGFSIASLARNTAAALGIGFVYFAIAESLVRGLKPQWQHWLVGDNAAAFVIGDPEQVFSIPGRTTVGSLLVVVLYAGVAWLVATTFFRARDVT